MEYVTQPYQRKALRKLKVTIHNHDRNYIFYFLPDVWHGGFQMQNDTECP